MKLRDFLERRELELLEKIAALRNELIPLEGELAEIRRARAAVEDSGGGVPELKRSSLEKILASTWSTHQSDTPLPLRHSALLAALGDPYADLTMKELVMKALREQFSNGA